MEAIKFRCPFGPSLDGFLLTHSCKVCKKEYVESYRRQCFAFNMILESKEDICIGCRLYKAAKLESAIEDMAEDLGFMVLHFKEACATLLDKTLPKEELPIGFLKKLDKIPLTYPADLKSKICPGPCEECKKYRELPLLSSKSLQEDNIEASFVVVGEVTHEFDADRAREAIERKLQLLNSKYIEYKGSSTS